MLKWVSEEFSAIAKETSNDRCDQIQGLTNTDHAQELTNAEQEQPPALSKGSQKSARQQKRSLRPSQSTRSSGVVKTSGSRQSERQRHKAPPVRIDGSVMQAKIETDTISSSFKEELNNRPLRRSERIANAALKRTYSASTVTRSNLPASPKTKALSKDASRGHKQRQGLPSKSSATDSRVTKRPYRKSLRRSSS